MLLLIDGYNIIAPVAAPGRGPKDRWLQFERRQLIDRLTAHLGDDLCRQTVVVFDAAGAPKRSLTQQGLPSRFVHQGIEIEFAVNYAEADDRIEELIAEHSSPKRLTVVSSDHRIQTAARRRGCLPIDSEPWFDALTDGRILLAIAWPLETKSAEASPEISAEKKGDTVAREDVQQWMREFGMEPDSAAKDPFIDNPFPDGYGEDLLDEN
jgi:uncharacterized protein